MPIMIQSLGTPILLYHLPQHVHVALLVFLFTKHGSYHFACGIINASDQAQAWPSLL